MGVKARRALVTGAASGIGEATVRVLTERGYAVVGLDRSGGDTVAGTSAPLLTVDLTVDDQVSSGVREAVALLGGLDALVCAAGVTDRGTAEETSPAVWDLMFGVNVRAPYLCAHEALPYLRQGEDPAIVNVGSQFGVIAAQGYVAYCASKAALIHLTRALAVDHAPEGIRVNAVCPGPVDTPMSRRHIQGSADPEETYRNMAERTLTNRFAAPEELARVIAFLLSKEADAVHGANLMADMGYSVH